MAPPNIGQGGQIKLIGFARADSTVTGTERVGPPGNGDHPFKERKKPQTVLQLPADKEQGAEDFYDTYWVRENDFPDTRIEMP